jgi:hypothetical protein
MIMNPAAGMKRIGDPLNTKQRNRGIAAKSEVKGTLTFPPQVLHVR